MAHHGTFFPPLPLQAINHVSFLCKSVTKSEKFYKDVLGFDSIKRPSSLKFKGAWLSKYGIGIHLIESNHVPVKEHEINPKDNHISFQCSDMEIVRNMLERNKIKYKTSQLQQGDIRVDQLFFHDPDGYMIEICNCEKLTRKTPHARMGGMVPRANTVGHANITGANNDFMVADVNFDSMIDDANNDPIGASFHMWELTRVGAATAAA